MKKHISMVMLSAVLLYSCGDSGQTDNQTGIDGKTKVTHEKDIPANLSNKGIGPVKNLSLDSTFDKNMIAEGKKIFENQCTTCHKKDESFLGPPMAGVTEVRSPEWIMNMIMAPEKMLEADTIAQALFKKYGTPMTNMRLTETQARSVLEYLRTL